MEWQHRPTEKEEKEFFKGLLFIALLGLGGFVFSVIYAHYHPEIFQARPYHIIIDLDGR